MPGISQDEFIRSVREAIGNHRPASASPNNREVARVVKASDDAVGRFVAMATDAKMQLYRVPESGLVESVVGILRGMSAKGVLLTDEPLPQRDALVGAIEAAGCTLVDLKDNDSAFTADAGVTLARLGIAETGSIAIRSGSNTRRLASLAVPEHIAILRERDIVPDLMDWTATLTAPIAANEVLITGPSKTADIELNLVWGVHGPKKVHVVLIG